MNINLTLNKKDVLLEVEQKNSDNMTHMSKQSLVNRAVGNQLPTGQALEMTSTMKNQGFGRSTF